ncbi:MAG TPA: DUF1573 domain-containing protein [Saprospiraceae bacterium]|nr:DUF1573 domain-containing protein [Saprospiraceae bacterium]
MRNQSFLLLLIALLAAACTQKQEERQIKVKTLEDGQDLSEIISSPLDKEGKLDTVHVAKMNFETSSYYFGEVREGDTIEHVFHFVNTGKSPLSIKNAQTSCGCTVPTWPEYMVAPGASDSISVVFDTKNKTGYQNKAITIIGNTYPNKTIVYLKGKVIGKKVE